MNPKRSIYEVHPVLTINQAWQEALPSMLSILDSPAQTTSRVETLLINSQSTIHPLLLWIHLILAFRRTLEINYKQYSQAVNPLTILCSHHLILTLNSILTETMRELHLITEEIHLNSNISVISTNSLHLSTMKEMAYHLRTTKTLNLHNIRIVARLHSTRTMVKHLSIRTMVRHLNTMIEINPHSTMIRKRLLTTEVLTLNHLSIPSKPKWDQTSSPTLAQCHIITGSK
jgi:hypothetical protein